MNDRARDGDVERIVEALTLNGDGDVRAGIAAHQVHRIVQRHVLGVLAVDRRDLVAGENAGLRRRRAVDRCHDIDGAVVLRHFQAEAAELTAEVGLECLELLLRIVGGMRVQGLDHALDRGLDQFRVGLLVDIVGEDALENIAEEIELLVGVGGL